MQSLSEVEKRIRAAGRVVLYLDFDGTLAPLVPDPASARMDPATGETLRRLASHSRLMTTIISGRAVEDLYARIRLDGLIYAGNHGMEIRGRNLRFVDPAAAARREQARRLSGELAARLRSVPGVLVDYKGLTASVHYLQAAESRIPEIEAVVRAAVKAAGAGFRVHPGKHAFEIVPQTGWHKGAAVQWINRQLGNGDLLPIYLGDDHSDEDAFAVLPDAVTVKVDGAPPSRARYQVKGPSEVAGFLSWLESCKQLAGPGRQPDGPVNSP